jgi:ERCC4-type nuclease
LRPAPQAILTASADALATVDGIGEKTAAKMRRILEASSADFGVGRLR